MPQNFQAEDVYKVLDTQILNKPNSQEALKLLQQVARQVQPILRARQWRVPLLSEFSPKNPGLLGLNIGGGGGGTQEIKVRLRKPGDDGTFYPYDFILGTMLHEIMHNVQGPHNAAFYKMLDTLTEECETLMAKGISGTGQGFDAASKGRLGSHAFIPTHNPPETQLKNVMLKAAEARAKQQAVMSAGPRRLGGSMRLPQNLSPAMAAAQAAERRTRDNLCFWVQIQGCPGLFNAFQLWACEL
ncbi:hypothetical protein WJX84_005300 [Apatococcus fuscideae]|uniref:WLM domain-containing protein n=1 Tax=Apatococcus fuscideae TaxID=2026836 RepID=A0AAW1SYS4_9CHLO